MWELQELKKMNEFFETNQFWYYYNKENVGDFNAIAVTAFDI